MIWRSWVRTLVVELGVHGTSNLHLNKKKINCHLISLSKGLHVHLRPLKILWYYTSYNTSP